MTLSDIATAGPYVGAPVVWTADAKGHGPKAVYQFSVATPGSPFQVVRNFSRSDSFVWNPMQEGTYRIRVSVKDGFGGRNGEAATAWYQAQSRVAGNDAVVSPTANPLVALYSAPPSPGAAMLVQFAKQGPDPSWQNTAPQPIVPGKSTNFIVAGMQPDTTYLMRHVLADGSVSAPLTFTTGSLPTSLQFPTFKVVQSPAAGTDLSQNIIFHAGLTGTMSPVNIANTVATDLDGKVVWYYDPVANDAYGYATNLEPGGTVMMLSGASPVIVGGNTVLKQVDLAGNTLRETNVQAVNARLARMNQSPIVAFDHEAKLLPNGDTVVVASSLKTVRYQGKPTTYTGNKVIVLDPNFQPVWAWNSFRWLDTNRLGTLGENAADWLHANSVSYSPRDGNLVVSFRSQDWAVKIDYANGTGNGHVVWKLGAGGDFNAVADVPAPWFSHQHDVRYVNDTTVLVFDNGNTRQASDPSAHSRGQQWVLDEPHRTATLVVNADLGNYSSFLGGARTLPNGNLAFTSGGLFTKDGPVGQSIQVLPSGSVVYVQQMSGMEYRSNFLSNLYSAPILG